MTIKNDLILWDDGVNCLCLLSIPSEQQYKYIDGLAFMKGQLGASFFSHSLKFAFQADQTLIGRLIQAIELG